MTLPKTADQYVTKEQMLQNIIMSMGGRAAEKLIMEDITTGASGDIQHATGVAREMVVSYGMSEQLGPIAYKSSHDEVFIGRDFGHSKQYSEEIAAKIDEENYKIVDTGYQKAVTLLEEHIDKLHAVANALLEKELLDEQEFKAVMEESPVTEEEEVNEQENC